MTALPPGCTVLPSLFGAPGRLVMGCFHPPRGEVRDRVVLLCAPLGHEHTRCHRSFWKLADQLARQGFAVMRFDCLGMGDSSLESDEVVLEDWLESIEVAAARALELSGASHMDFVGLRLSATLGYLASRAARIDLERLVLWHPVVDGQAAFQELRAAHDVFAQSLGHAGAASAGEAIEVLGYRYSPELVRQVDAIDLMQGELPRVKQVILLDNSAGGELRPFQERLAASGAKASYEHLPESEVWLAEIYKLVMPHESVRAIVGLLAGEER